MYGVLNERRVVWVFKRSLRVSQDRRVLLAGVSCLARFLLSEILNPHGQSGKFQGVFVCARRENLSSRPMRLQAERKWLADMKAGRHVSFVCYDATLERPDEDDRVQTKTNDMLANERALKHEKTVNIKQARRVCLCSPR